ncbi:MAG: hypothetical protein NTY68_00190 [Candidatus Micrarchaeota archaeon]|nr:hypothetical protein [Candidatus Micrarchaeota archaeon]
MAFAFGSIFRMYGIYIVMIIALAGIALVLSDMNSASFSDEEMITCLPNDTSCVLYNETVPASAAGSANTGIR